VETEKSKSQKQLFSKIYESEEQAGGNTQGGVLVDIKTFRHGKERLPPYHVKLCFQTWQSDMARGGDLVAVPCVLCQRHGIRGAVMPETPPSCPVVTLEEMPSRLLALSELVSTGYRVQQLVARSSSCQNLVL
jgi:hypothetical protein